MIGLHNYSPEYLGKSLELVLKNKNKFPFHELVNPVTKLSAANVDAAFKSLDMKNSVRPGIKSN